LSPASTAVREAHPSVLALLLASARALVTLPTYREAAHMGYRLVRHGDAMLLT
jgi:hypothetical protein